MIEVDSLSKDKLPDIKIIFKCELKSYKLSSLDDLFKRALGLKSLKFEISKIRKKLVDSPIRKSNYINFLLYNTISSRKKNLKLCALIFCVINIVSGKLSFSNFFLF